MKKTKFLSLLVFAPLLAGCGSNFGAPKFAKYGSEVKAKDFAKHFESALKDSSLNKKAKLGSLLLKQTSGDKMQGEVTRDKKAIRSFENTNVTTAEIAYDSKNIILKNDNSTEMVQKSTSLAGDDFMEMSTTSSTQQQISKIKGKKYGVTVDFIDKTYEKDELDPDYKPADSYDNLFKGQVVYVLTTSYMNFLSEYDSVDAKEQKNYKFYENGKIFTMEFKNTEEIKTDESKGKMDIQWTIQVDLTEGKWSLKTMTQETVEVEVLKEYYDSGFKYVKGDVVKEAYLDVQDASAQQKEVKLEAADLSKYELVA